MTQSINSIVEKVAEAGPGHAADYHHVGMGFKSNAPEAVLHNRKRWLSTVHGYDDRGGNLEYLAFFLACYRAASAGTGECPKGLMLTGGTGRGKTLAMRILSSWARIPMVTAIDIVQEFRRDRHACLDVYGRPSVLTIGGRDVTPDLIIDDLGTDEICMHYGARDDVLPMIIDARYRLWQRTGARLHLTTNMSLKRIKDTDGIEERYGERTLSRLREMCEIQLFGGPDRRVER